jgi:hypothetical protein
MPLRRHLVSSAAVVAAAASLTACGAKEHVSVAKTEGVYVTAGELKYQVQISRILNPSDFEDRDYLTGIASYDRTLGKDEQWFGVFLRAINMTNAAHPTSDRLTIKDTTGAQFQPVRVDPNVNRVAWKSVVVKGGDQVPVPGSLARENDTQGGLVLFKIPVPAFANRPLELHIASATGGGDAIVELDI